MFIVIVFFFHLAAAIPILHILFGLPLIIWIPHIHFVDLVFFLLGTVEVIKRELPQATYSLSIQRTCYFLYMVVQNAQDIIFNAIT